MKAQLEQINTKINSSQSETEQQTLNISKEKLEAQIAHLESAHKKIIKDFEESTGKLTILEVHKNAKEESIERIKTQLNPLEKQNKTLDTKLKELSSELEELINSQNMYNKADSLKNEITQLETMRLKEKNTSKLEKINQNLHEKKEIFRQVIDWNQKIVEKKIQLKETTEQYASNNSLIIKLKQELTKAKVELNDLNKEIATRMKTKRALSQDNEALNKLINQLETKSSVEPIKLQNAKTDQIGRLKISIIAHEKAVSELEEAKKELNTRLSAEGKKKTSPIFGVLMSTFEKISKNIQSEQQAIESETTNITLLEKEIIDLRKSIEQEATQTSENQNLHIATFDDLKEISKVNNNSITEAKIAGEKKELEIMEHVLKEEGKKLSKLQKEIETLLNARARSEGLKNDVLINEPPTQENKHKIKQEIENLNRVIVENKVIATLGKKPSAIDQEQHKLATEALNKKNRLEETLKYFEEYEELSKKSTKTRENTLNLQVIELEKSMQAKEQKMRDINERLAVLENSLT